MHNYDTRMELQKTNELAYFGKVQFARQKVFIGFSQKPQYFKFYEGKKDLGLKSHFPEDYDQGPIL